MAICLRKYPPFTIVARKAVKNYKIPDTNIELKKGVPIIIPVYALHHDPDYYKNPEVYKGETTKTNINIYEDIERFSMFERKI